MRSNEISVSYVHQDDQTTTKKAPYETYDHESLNEKIAVDIGKRICEHFKERARVRVTWE